MHVVSHTEIQDKQLVCCVPVVEGEEYKINKLKTNLVVFGNSFLLAAARNEKEGTG